MKIDDQLNAIRDLMQFDIGNRGLRTVPTDNLISNTLPDFAAACRSFENVKGGNVAIVTGFVIASVDPPRAETDGPPGALFLARVLQALGNKVSLVTDRYCLSALAAGVKGCGLDGEIRVLETPLQANESFVEDFRAEVGPLTHLISIERVGPSHTPTSIRSQRDASDLDEDRFLAEVSDRQFDCCHNMRGRDITLMTSPLHLLFEERIAPVTIGIGDGGNELGMGKLPWRTIRDNIPGGGLVACRIPTDHLLVCGISNWGGYALAQGICLTNGSSVASKIFDATEERELLERMVADGPLVDGVRGEAGVSVDGVDFDTYLAPICEFIRAG